MLKLNHLREQPSHSVQQNQQNQQDADYFQLRIHWSAYSFEEDIKELMHLTTSKAVSYPHHQPEPVIYAKACKQT